MDAPKIDHNIERWVAFCQNEEAAEKELQDKLLIVAQKKLIVSAKKQLVDSKSHPHNLYIYKFTIFTAPK